jgi:hypothetical protein
MTWRVRPPLHLCQIDDYFVGLDLVRERYLLYKGDTAGCIRRFLEGQANQHDVASLVMQRIIEQGEVCESPFRIRVSPPTSDVVRECSQSFAWMPALRAAIAQVRERRVLASKPLARILEGLSQEMGSGLTPSPRDCLSVVTAFRNARRYLSQNDQCLVCGIAMSRMMARRGARVQLVIGVALPFVAHCWIQVGETVLSDTVDRVRPYTPILVV